MSDSTTLAIAALGSLTTVLCAVVTGIVTFMTHAKINVLEKNTNSITAALVKTTENEALARGVKIGQDAQVGPQGPQGPKGGN